MESEHVIFLEDRLVFDYGWLRRIYGVPDEYGSVEVPYANIANLPVEPRVDLEKHDIDTDNQDNRRLPPIHVAKVGKDIVFYLHRNLERASEPPEEFLIGPFLVDENKEE